MNNSKFLFHVAAWTAAAFTLMAAPTHAVTLGVVASSVYQSGTTALVYHGHTVVASTNMNRLEAGGSFRVTCMSPDTGSITGSRSLPAAALLGGLQLYVTVPAQLPGLKPMPGFESAPRGANLQCSYDWTAFSREGQYTIGIPGISVPVGGGEMSLSSSVSFRMRKPGTATGNDDACIP